ALHLLYAEELQLLVLRPSLGLRGLRFVLPEQSPCALGHAEETGFVATDLNDAVQILNVGTQTLSNLSRRIKFQNVAVRFAVDGRRLRVIARGILGDVGRQICRLAIA